ncbi:MAG: hypothetical protein LKJ76_07240 [Lachnospiraceae bacterium]|jgi:uncharacterized protein (DUF1778 family)|nr:hypothetical protein [Lachnospiraceae bacterium]
MGMRKMDKIYRRSTQLGNTPKKKKDEHARKRNTIMNFRVSPKEKELIEKRCKLSGLPKAEFFLESCLYQTIFVRENSRTFEAIRDELKIIDDRLAGIDKADDLDPWIVESLKTITQILDSFFRQN